MIIDLSQSKFFTQDPDIRFAKEYLLPLGAWKEGWRRYQLLEYTQSDLRDYFFMKYGRRLSWNSLNKWIIKTEVYIVSRPVLERGAKVVNSDIFGKHEQYILEEVTRNLRFEGSSDSRIII